MFQGGASNQFSAICYNLLEDGTQVQTANYLTTGVWSEGAIKEARKYCQPNEVASNKPSGYRTIADASQWTVD